MPPKDRLQHLRLNMPELFEHVSLRGFKRLIAQAHKASDEVGVGPKGCKLLIIGSRRLGKGICLIGYMGSVYMCLVYTWETWR